MCQFSVNQTKNWREQVSLNIGAVIFKQHFCHNNRQEKPSSSKPEFLKQLSLLLKPPREFTAGGEFIFKHSHLFQAKGTLCDSKGTPGWSLWCGTSITPRAGLGAPRGAAATPKSGEKRGFGVGEGAMPLQVPCVGLCPHLVTATRKDRARVAPRGPGAATQGRTETGSQHGEGKGCVRGGEAEKGDEKKKK